MRNEQSLPSGGAGTFRQSRPVAIFLICLAHFISHLHILLLPPAFAVLALDYGVSFTQLGLALTIYNVATTVTQTPVGIVVDRIGARLVLTAGLVLAGISFVAIGLSTSYLALLVFMVAAGIANSVYHPADYALLTALVDKGRMGRALSLHTFAGYLGSAAAPLLIAVALALWDWRAGVIAAGVLSIVVAIAMPVLPDVRAPAPDPDEAGREKAGKERNIIGLAVLTGFFFLISLSLSGIQGFSVVVLGGEGRIAPTVVSTALSVFLFSLALGVLAGGILADKTPHHERIAILGFALAGLLVLPLAFTEVGVGMLFVLFAAAGFMVGMVMPSRDMLVQRFARRKSIGKTFGVVTTGLNAGGIVGPLLFGMLVDHGLPWAVFVLSSAFMFATALLAALYKVDAEKPSLDAGRQ